MDFCNIGELGRCLFMHAAGKVLRKLASGDPHAFVEFNGCLFIGVGLQLMTFDFF
jgi:hypothetical protein